MQLNFYTKYKYLITAAFIIYVGLLFFLSLYPFQSSPIDLAQYIFGIRTDRIIHFTMFFPFPFLFRFVYELNHLVNRIKINRYILIVLTGLLIASLTEYLQSFNISRDFDLLDLAANYSAVLISSFLVFLLDKYVDNAWFS